MDVTQTGPFRLLDLPDEIVLLVINYLDYDSLLNATYVNRYLCQLVQPFIYNSITVLHGDKALNLSRSLSKDHRRPQWIRSLLISTKFYQEHALMKLPSFFSRMTNLQDLRLETPDCNNKKPGDRLYWIALQDWYENIFRAASVAVNEPEKRILPNLKSCALIDRVHASLRLTCPGVIHFVDTERELYPTSRYSSIFLHPKLENLTISCMTTDAPKKLFEFIDDTNSLKRSTALEHLHLEECDFHAPSLEVLLSFPRALKSLKLSEGVRYDQRFRATSSSRINGNMGPRQLSRALTTTCRDSLESLSLSLGHQRSHGQSINHINHSLNLSELDNLKNLEIHHHTLDLIRPRPDCDHNTWRRLPPSLEILKIFDLPLISPTPTARQPNMPLKTCFILEKQNHGVPNLKKIIYSYEHHESADDEMDFNDLLLNLVYNDANNHPQANATLTHPTPGILNNPILNILQQAVGAVNGLPPQPAPTATVAPTNLNIVTAPTNPNLDVPPQRLAPPRFRWRTGPPIARPRPAPELSRSDTAKLDLLKSIHNHVLKDFIQTNTILQIELVTLPHGFIPPYLFPEDKPKVQEAWFTSTDPMTPDDLLENIKRKREAMRLRAEAERCSAPNMPGTARTSSNVSERTRSRSRFMQRMRQGEFDDDGPPPTGHDADDESDEAESESDDDDDVLDLLAAGHFDGDNDDVDMDDASSQASGSVYMDASAEIEMSDVDADNYNSDSEDDSSDDYLPGRA